MKKTKFVLQINLGNVGMSAPSDVAEALRSVVERLNRGHIHGGILDTNGNSVGAFVFGSSNLKVK